MPALQAHPVCRLAIILVSTRPCSLARLTRLPSTVPCHVAAICMAVALASAAVVVEVLQEAWDSVVMLVQLELDMAVMVAMADLAAVAALDHRHRLFNATHPLDDPLAFPSITWSTLCHAALASSISQV